MIRIDDLGNTFIVDRARLESGEAIDPDGKHANVVFITFTGHWNRRESKAVDLRVMLGDAGADVLAHSLIHAVEEANADHADDLARARAQLDGHIDNPMLDAWLDSARLSRAVVEEGTRAEATGAIDRMVAGLAEQMGVRLDRPTLRAAAFTLAVVQALQIASAPDHPPESHDDPAYAFALTSAIGGMIDVIVTRYDQTGVAP